MMVLLRCLKRILFVIPITVFCGYCSADPLIFDGCVATRDRAVVSVADDRIKDLVQSSQEGGQLVLRYNTAALPRLSETAQMFFYAHECGRLALGYPVDAASTVQAAERADCWALATLQRSKMLQDEQAIAALQSELKFSDDEWRVVPGPQREFHLTSCATRGGLRMPASALPPEEQLRLDRCVQICGDRLWHCEKTCRDDSCRTPCQATFSHCQTACGKR